MKGDTPPSETGIKAWRYHRLLQCSAPTAPRLASDRTSGAAKAAIGWLWDKPVIH